jgi:hypothetical protein
MKEKRVEYGTKVTKLKKILKDRRDEDDKE